MQKLLNTSRKLDGKIRKARQDKETMTKQWQDFQEKLRASFISQRQQYNADFQKDKDELLQMGQQKVEILQQIQCLVVKNEHPGGVTQPPLAPTKEDVEACNELMSEGVMGRYRRRCRQPKIRAGGGSSRWEPHGGGSSSAKSSTGRSYPEGELGDATPGSLPVATPQLGGGVSSTASAAVDSFECFPSDLYHYREAMRLGKDPYMTSPSFAEKEPYSRGTFLRPDSNATSSRTCQGCRCQVVAKGCSAHHHPRRRAHRLRDGPVQQSTRPHGVADRRIGIEPDLGSSHLSTMRAECAPDFGLVIGPGPVRRLLGCDWPQSDTPGEDVLKCGCHSDARFCWCTVVEAVICSCESASLVCYWPLGNGTVSLFGGTWVLESCKGMLWGVAAWDLDLTRNAASFDLSWPSSCNITATVGDARLPLPSPQLCCYGRNRCTCAIHAAPSSLSQSCQLLPLAVGRNCNVGSCDSVGQSTFAILEQMFEIYFCNP